MLVYGLGTAAWVVANITFFSLIDPPAPITLAIVTNVAFVGFVTTALVRTLQRNEAALNAQRAQIDLQARLLDQVGSAVIATDNEAVVTYWNPAAERLYGWSADEAIGTPIYSLTVPTSGQEEAEAIMAETFERTGSWEGEFDVTRKDGSTFPALVANTLIRNPDGSVAGVIGVSRDLSAEVEARRKLVEAGEEKDRFLTAVSHELRTPLTTVLGFAQELRDGRASDDDLAQYHQVVFDQALEMSRLIDDLLVAGQLREGGLKVASEPVPIEPIVRQVLAPLPDSVAVIECNDCAITAAADPLRVRQILRNLITNGIRHGAPPVTLDGHPDGDRVVVEVSDRGPGVSPELERVMYSAYERDPSAGPETQSIGLGLYVSRELAQLMDGQLTYRREDDRTIFALDLPALED